jgi:hypothetical protein
LIDGGICNPALVADVISARQIICLATPELSSVDIWERTEERQAMKEMVLQLPGPEEKWRQFLEFDGQITATILKECRQAHIPIVARPRTESVAETVKKVARILAIQAKDE